MWVMAVRMRCCCARGDRDLAQEVVGRVAVVCFGVGVDLEVLDVEPVVVPHALVHHLGVTGARGEPLAGPPEGGEPFLVGPAHVVQLASTMPSVSGIAT